MRKTALDPRDGWRRRFAILPTKVGDEWIWLEWFERRFMGEYNEVRLSTKPKLTQGDPRWFTTPVMKTATATAVGGSSTDPSLEAVRRVLQSTFWTSESGPHLGRGNVPTGKREYAIKIRFESLREMDAAHALFSAIQNG